MGADPIALPVLDYLVADPRIDFSAVLTQPDRPSGRGKKLRMNPVKAWATEHGIEIGDPDKPSDTELEWIHELGIQFALVMAYGHILKRNLLNAPLLGTWNLHASLLPLHRGASPVESALLAGDTQTGVSLMKIIPKMDAGPVLDIEPVMISLEETSPTLREKLAHACVPLVERNIEKLALGNLILWIRMIPLPPTVVKSQSRMGVWTFLCLLSSSNDAFALLPTGPAASSIWKIESRLLERLSKGLPQLLLLEQYFLQTRTASLSPHLKMLFASVSFNDQVVE